MVGPQLQVAVDVGCQRHRVAVGDVAGRGEQQGIQTSTYTGAPIPDPTVL
jgi:hypothetical protein